MKKKVTDMVKCESCIHHYVCEIKKDYEKKTVEVPDMDNVIVSLKCKYHTNGSVVLTPRPHF